MKDRRSMLSKELLDFLREAKDFILALHQGATARELERIRNRIAVKKQKEIPATGNVYAKKSKTRKRNY